MGDWALAEDLVRAALAATCGVPEVCALGLRHDDVRVAAAALPDLGPAQRLAGAVAPVLGVEGRRAARPASRGRSVATNKPEASARLVRPSIVQRTLSAST